MFAINLIKLWIEMNVHKSFISFRCIEIQTSQEMWFILFRYDDVRRPSFMEIYLLRMLRMQMQANVRMRRERQKDFSLASDIKN